MHGDDGAELFPRLLDHGDVGEEGVTDAIVGAGDGEVRFGAVDEGGEVAFPQGVDLGVVHARAGPMVDGGGDRVDVERLHSVASSARCAGWIGRLVDDFIDDVVGAAGEGLDGLFDVVVAFEPDQRLILLEMGLVEALELRLGELADVEPLNGLGFHGLLDRLDPGDDEGGHAVTVSVPAGNSRPWCAAVSSDGGAAVGRIGVVGGPAVVPAMVQAPGQGANCRKGRRRRSGREELAGRCGWIRVDGSVVAGVGWVRDGCRPASRRGPTLAPSTRPAAHR